MGKKTSTELEHNYMNETLNVGSWEMQPYNGRNSHELKQQKINWIIFKIKGKIKDISITLSIKTSLLQHSKQIKHMFA